MPRNRWDYKILLGDIWKNEEMTFEQRRDEIVRRLRASSWFKSADAQDRTLLPCLVDELSEVDDQDYFNMVWNLIYDQADIDRCWIDTIK